MKPPPPPTVSMRYLVPGASVLNPHLIPAELVMSTNSIGLESFLAVCPEPSFTNGQVTQIVETSEAIRMVFMGVQDFGSIFQFLQLVNSQSLFQRRIRILSLSS